MDSPQSPASPVYTPAAASPGLFGTKIPSSVTFAVVVLLFFLPFVEIRCNDMKLQSVSGFQLATGFKTEKGGGGGFADDTLTKSTTNSDKQHPNMYAMAALILGVAGLGLCFVNNRMAAAGGLASAVLGLAALVGLWLDIKKQMRTGVFGNLAEKTKDVTSGNVPEVDSGINKIGEGLSGMKITVEFAPFFYVAVVAFAVAAFFCFKRMQSSK